MDAVTEFGNEPHLYAALSCPASPQLCEQPDSERELAVIYHVNNFHFEMNNFEPINSIRDIPEFGNSRPDNSVSDTSKPDNSEPENSRAWPSPCYWWRAIGDHNLKYIQSLSVFGQALCPGIENGILVGYDRSSKSIEVAETAGVSTEWVYLGAVSALQQMQNFESKKDELRATLEVIVREGLDLQKLEEMVKLLGGRGRWYLRD